MGIYELSDDRKKIKFLLLVSQLIVYSLFLASHFLAWATVHTCSIPIQWDVFLGIETVGGLFSITGLNAYLIMNLLINGNYLQKYKNKSLMSLICGFGLIAFFALFFIRFTWDIAWHLEEFVFGYYLWLFAAISTLVLGIVFYILVKKQYFTTP